MKMILWTAMVLFSVGALAADEKKVACPIQFKKTGLCAELTWTILPKKVEMPTENDKAEFTLQVFKNPRLPVGSSGAQEPLAQDLAVKLFMPSMGHGSLPTQVEAEVDEKGHKISGKFRVKDVYFSMPGKWEIRLELKKAAAVLDRAAVPYTL